MTERELLKDKKRIVIKIGSSSLTHAETGDLNLAKIEKLVRIISDMRGMGKEVILVSSGAIATGRQTLGGKKPETVAEKQAYAAVPGTSHDGVPEAFLRVQPDCGTDPDH